MFLIVWDHSESRRVQRSRIRFASRELAEVTAKLLNRIRPEVEHWVENAERTDVPRFDAQGPVQA